MPWVILVAGAGHCSLLTDTTKFPILEVMGAQHFNFAPKVPENGVFSEPDFSTLDENFRTRRKFSDSQKFKWGAFAPFSHDTAEDKQV